MGNFTEEIKNSIKRVERQTIFRAVMFIIAGLIMIIFPLKVAEFVCYGVAAFFTVFGARFIISYIGKDLVRDFFRYDLVFGISLLIFAIFLIAKAEKVISFIPTIIGIIVVLNGFFKLQNAVDFLRSKGQGVAGDSWSLMLIVAVINIAIGAFLIWDPFTSTKVVYILLGIGVLYSGISDIIVAFQFKKVVKETGQVLEHLITDGRTVEGRGEIIEEDRFK